MNDNRTLIEISGDGASEQADGPVAWLDPSNGTPVRVLRISNKVVRVVVRQRGERGSYVLDIGGHRYQTDALNERARAIQGMAARSASPAGPAPVVAPMPGLVLRVNVAAGDAVTPGQGVVVMEAMKMENELRASAAAVVKSIRVAPGTAVEKGTVLIELE